MRFLKLFSLSIVLIFTSITCAPHADVPSNVIGAGKKDDPPPPVNGPLQKRIKACLDHVASRQLEVSHPFWTVFHGILGQGFETKLLDRATGKSVNAIDYICKGGKIDGMEFIPTQDGLDVLITPGTGRGQGHQDQFVAEMIQWGMPGDKEFLVNGKKYTFMDFCRQSRAKASVKEKQELTWAIIIIGQFFGTDAAWTNNKGEKLTFEDVVRYEVKEPIDSAACGGTHRLFGLTWAYHLHLKNGGKTIGVWKDVADKLDLYKKKAHQYQNPDGGFSKNYVSSEGPGKDIGASGHVLEWLAFAMTDKELKQPWVEDSVNALVQMILDNRNNELESGALYHAAHGLHIYYNRMFGPVGKSDPVIPLPPKE